MDSDGFYLSGLQLWWRSLVTPVTSFPMPMALANGSDLQYPLFSHYYLWSICSILFNMQIYIYIGIPSVFCVPHYLKHHSKSNTIYIRICTAGRPLAQPRPEDASLHFPSRDFEYFVRSLLHSWGKQLATLGLSYWDKGGCGWTWAAWWTASSSLGIMLRYIYIYIYLSIYLYLKDLFRGLINSINQHSHHRGPPPCNLTVQTLNRP